MWSPLSWAKPRELLPPFIVPGFPSVRNKRFRRALLFAGKPKHILPSYVSALRNTTLVQPCVLCGQRNPNRQDACT